MKFVAECDFVHLGLESDHVSSGRGHGGRHPCRKMGGAAGGGSGVVSECWDIDEEASFTSIGQAMDSVDKA